MLTSNIIDQLKDLLQDINDINISNESIQSMQIAMYLEGQTATLYIPATTEEMINYLKLLHGYNVIANVLISNNIDTNDDTIAIFVVLHELGHYVDSKRIGTKQYNILAAEQYATIDCSNVRTITELEIKQEEYRQLSIEARADRYAIHIIKHLNI